jgi:hypothetical protein
MKKISGFLKTIFDAFPSLLFVVDEDIRIYHLNSAAASGMGLNLTDTFLKRTGDALHCIHSTETKEGCGHARKCKDCIVRNSINRIFSGEKIIRSQEKMTLVQNGNSREINLQVTTAPFEYNNRQYALLILDDITELTQLRSLLPICSYCKKIRNDQSYWEQLEGYIHDHMDVDFSHSICPDCLQEKYPKLAPRILEIIKSKSAEAVPLAVSQ